MERFSVFAAIASKVVASLVRKYEKAQQKFNGELWLFSQAFINELWLTKRKKKKKEKMEIFVAEFLDCTKG